MGEGIFNNMGARLTAFIFHIPEAEKSTMRDWFGKLFSLIDFMMPSLPSRGGHLADLELR